MAYYDHSKAKYEQDCKLKYEQLKAYLAAKDENGKITDWMAYQYLIKMETNIAELEKKVKAYEAFFSMLKGLLPKEHSLYDVIG